MEREGLETGSSGQADREVILSSGEHISEFHASSGGPWREVVRRLPPGIVNRLSARTTAPIKLAFLVPRLYSQLARGNQALIWDYEVELKPRWTPADPNPYLEEIIAGRRDHYIATLESWRACREQLRAIPEPEWRQILMPPLDGIALSCVLAQWNPRLYVEIGSGVSTRFARRAIEHWRLRTEIMSIDPAPRLPVDNLCDTRLRCRLEEVDLSVFDQVGAGDVVVLDGSHRCLMNSDVTTFFLDILPRLPAGVLIGIHDVYLPYDYPEQFEQQFLASEQYILAALLLGDRCQRYHLEFPAAYVSETVDRNCLDAVLPVFEPWKSHFPAAPVYGQMLWLRLALPSAPASSHQG